MPYFEQQDKVLFIPLLLILLVDIAKQRGIAPDKLLKGSKLFFSDLANAELRISHQQFTRIVENTCKLLPHGDTAFLLGSRLYPHHLEAGGQTIAHSENLSDVLTAVKQFHFQLFPFLFMHQAKTQQHQVLMFNQAITIEKSNYYQFICELFSSLLVAIAKQKNLPLSRLSLRFPYSTPRHIEQYHAYLPCKFSFTPCSSAPHNQQESDYFPLQVKFDNGLLNLPLEHANATLMQHYLHKAANSSNKIGFIQYVMQLLTKRVKRKQEVNADWLAAHLKISQATLKRKFAQHNVNYQQIIDMVRQQQAVFLLTEKNFNNEKIAEDLNFSDTTNFRRSFKRWTGFTPQTFKKAI